MLGAGWEQHAQQPFWSAQRNGYMLIAKRPLVKRLPQTPILPTGFAIIATTGICPLSVPPPTIHYRLSRFLSMHDAIEQHCIATD